MTRRKDQRALEPIREYDPYQPRAFMTRDEFAARHRFKQAAEIEGWFKKKPKSDAGAKEVKPTVETPSAEPGRKYKRVGLYYIRSEA